MRLHYDQLVHDGCEHGVYSNVGALVRRGRVARIKGEEVGDGIGEDEEDGRKRSNSSAPLRELLLARESVDAGRAVCFLCSPGDLDHNHACTETSVTDGANLHF